jgi:hypothetical protein
MEGLWRRTVWGSGCEDDGLRLTAFPTALVHWILGQRLINIPCEI